MNENNLNGTWEECKNDGFKLKINGNKYVSFYKGFRYGKGTIVYDDKSFTLTSTHARTKLFFWTPFVETVEGNYSRIEDIIIITSNIEGRYSGQNGRWVLLRK